MKVLDENKNGDTRTVSNGMEWVLGQRMTNPGVPMIASMSLGGDGNIITMNEAVQTLHDAGVIVSVSAGNDAVDACTQSPARAPVAVTVGNAQIRSEGDQDGTTGIDQRWPTSNFGSCVDIWAPGTDIASAGHLADDGVAIMTGTSMSCPHVSGTLALILARNPGITPDDAIAQLLSNAVSGVMTDIRASPNKYLQVPSPLPTVFAFGTATENCEALGFMTPSTEAECFAALNSNLDWQGLPLTISNHFNEVQCDLFAATLPPCYASAVTVYWNTCPGFTPAGASPDAGQVCIDV